MSKPPHVSDYPVQQHAYEVAEVVKSDGFTERTIRGKITFKGNMPGMLQLAEEEFFHPIQSGFLRKQIDPEIDDQNKSVDYVIIDQQMYVR